MAPCRFVAYRDVAGVRDVQATKCIVAELES
jgi:hypothetical protein